jgi:hypothetical protein
MRMRQFFKELFSDNNHINEKSFIGFLAFCVMIIFAVVDIVTGTLGKELIIQEFIFEAFKWLTLGSFGIASVDKWINSNKKNNIEGEGAE